jgi:hypothetical protein
MILGSPAVGSRWATYSDMRLSKYPAILLTTLVMILVTAGMASSATVRKQDRVGDASAAFDIRWARYTNADHAVVFAVKVRDLRSFTVVGGYLAEIGDYDGYEFRVWRRDGHGHTALNYTEGNGASRVACNSVRVHKDSNRDHVRVAIPRSCLPKVTGRLRMAASTGSSTRYRAASTPPERRGWLRTNSYLQW